MALASEIIDQAIRRLNELSTTAPIRWTRAELLVFLNDALNELNLIAADYQDAVPVTIDNTTNVWSLPANVIGPFAARLDTGYLQRESIEDLDKESNWEDPSIVRMNPKSWASLGLTKFVITPRPALTRTLYVEALLEYPPAPDAPVSLQAWIRPEYERALEDFMVSRAMFKEGGAELQQGLAFYNRFLDVVQQLSHRNIIRRYPAWDVAPESRTSVTNLRESVEPTETKV